MLLQAQMARFTGPEQLLADAYYDVQQKAPKQLQEQVESEVQISWHNESAQAGLFGKPHTLAFNREDVKVLIANVLQHQNKRKAVAKPGKHACLLKIRYLTALTTSWTCAVTQALTTFTFT